MNIDLLNTCNLIWICMLLHLIADFCLQGCLANLKQKEWVENQVKKLYKTYEGKEKSFEWQVFLRKKYKNDYIAGLICHAFMWSVVTFFPLMFITDSILFSILVVANIVIHTIVDHMKANMHRINLCEDQLIHLAEVIATVLIARGV